MQALFINKILQLLWPHLSPAIHKEVMRQAKAPVDDALAKIPVLEDIRIDKLDLGERPFRVDSFKSYQTNDDEIIFEAPLFWGGDITLRMTAVVRAGPLYIDLPVTVSDIQLKAMARVTLKPLVETLPCVGGVTVALLEEPTIDFRLSLLDSPDIMALPGVPLAVKTAIKLVAGKMLVFPNEFAVPIMPGYGMPPPPQGMLRVRVVAAHDLQGGSFMDEVDPFVMLEVREGRSSHTSTKPNSISPTWDETIELVVDDPSIQSLKVAIMDDNVIAGDAVVGGTRIGLAGTSFMQVPHMPLVIRLPVYAPGDDGDFYMAGAPEIDSAARIAATDAAVTAAVAALPKRRTLIGRFLRKKRAEKLTARIVAEHAAAESATGVSPSAQSINSETMLVGSDDEGIRRPAVPAGTVMGEVTLEVTFIPFAGAEQPLPSSSMSPTLKSVEEKDKSLKLAPTIRRSLLSEGFTGGARPVQGVLTVHLKKVTGLAEPIDSYVALRLYDPHRLPIPDIIYNTKVELNEDAPRFNYNADFVNISSASVLTLTVYAQPGLMAALTAFKVPYLQKAQAKMLGKVRIPVEAVVKDGRLRDIIPLQEAETGEMHLALEWASVNFETGRN